MKKYLFNSNIHGYDKVTLDSFNVDEVSEDILIFVIDNTCDENMVDYYGIVNKALRNKNRIILIGVDDNNKVFRPLASLMITFNNYDIYQIPDKNSLSAKKLLTIESRTPDLYEVQTFIGGDITAYNDMSTLLLGIESLVDEGNQDKLKSFLEDHLESIENLTVTLNKMKKDCDAFNSNELIDTMNAMKQNEEKLNKIIEDKEQELKTVKLDRDKQTVDANKLKRENEKLKNKAEVDEQEKQYHTGSAVTLYKEIKTSSINCKTKIVLYFKEISYVSYTNSLISTLMYSLESRKLNPKLVIFDTSTSLYDTYGTLKPLDIQQYMTRKSEIINNAPRILMAEPHVALLEDILTSDRGFQVVIVYDRMKSKNDIVTGNNVTKFFVVNSSTEFNNVKSKLGITDVSKVITRVNSGIDGDYLDIPFIEGYNRNASTESAQRMKYNRLTCAHTGVNLLNTIIEKSRIDSIKS